MSSNKIKTIGLVVVIIIVLDLAFAQLLKHATDFWEATYPPMDHRIRSEQFHHELVKNRLIDERWGPINYSFATNSLGFKDAEVREVPKETNEKRILILGDSFTEGSGFSYANTFVGQIAGAYKERGIRVLNGGVASYAPEIYLRRTKNIIGNLGYKIDRVVVFIDVSDIQDEIVKYTLSDQGNLQVPDNSQEKMIDRIGHWFRDNSMSARLFTLIRDNLSFLKKHIKRRMRTADLLKKSYWDVTPAEMTAHAVVPHAASEWTYNQDAWEAFGKRGRAKAAVNMTELAKFLRDQKIGLTIAIYPWPDQILNDPEAPRHRGFWNNWAKKEGVPVIDLFPSFTKQKPYDVLGKYFLANDMHWNQNGHDLVAQEFLKSYELED